MAVLNRNYWQGLIDQFYGEYLVTAEKFYGTLPEHCKQTKFCMVGLDNAAGASTNTILNEIAINSDGLKNLPEDAFKELIFHEMEHIRTAQNIYFSGKTGLEGEYVDNGGNGSNDFWQGGAINEALTELSAEQLLGRKLVNGCYMEIICYLKQIGALLGLDDKRLLKFYNINGRKMLIDEFEKITKNKNSYLDIENILDLFHVYHSRDLAAEFEQKGKLDSLFGSNLSEQTKSYRHHFKLKLYECLQTAVRKETLPKEICEVKKEMIENLAPKFNTQSVDTVTV